MSEHMPTLPDDVIELIDAINVMNTIRHLFVGNVSKWTREDDLVRLFSIYGEIENMKIMYNSRQMGRKDKRGWRHRNYVFVTYKCPFDALDAICALHDRDILGINGKNGRLAVVVATNTSR